MRRPLRTALVVAVVLGPAVGCAPDDGETGAPTTTTFPGLVAKASERKAIVDAYDGHWEPCYRYLNDDDRGEPIGNYFAGERRDDLPGQVADIAGRQLEVRGDPTVGSGPSSWMAIVRWPSTARSTARSSSTMTPVRW